MDTRARRRSSHLLLTKTLVEELSCFQQTHHAPCGRQSRDEHETILPPVHEACRRSLRAIRRACYLLLAEHIAVRLPGGI